MYLIVWMPRHLMMVPPIWITELELASVTNIGSVGELPAYVLAWASKVYARGMPREFTPPPYNMVFFHIHMARRLLAQLCIVISDVDPMEAMAVSPVAPPMACLFCTILVGRVIMDLTRINMAKSTIISPTASIEIAELEANSHRVCGRRREPSSS